LCKIKRKDLVVFILAIDRDLLVLKKFYTLDSWSLRVHVELFSLQSADEVTQVEKNQREESASRINLLSDHDSSYLILSEVSADSW